MKSEKQVLAQMIRDTVSMLCRNSLTNSSGVRIQGLIGITVDESDVFLVQLDESYSTADEVPVDSNQSDTINTPGVDVSDVWPTSTTFRKRSAKPPRPSAAAAASSFVAESDVITIPDDEDANDVKTEFDQEGWYDGSIIGQVSDLADSSTVKYEATGIEGGEEAEPGNEEASELADQNPESSWQSDMYTDAEAMQAQVKHEGVAARPYIKPESWSQQARQIVRRYRQRQQQRQLVPNADNSGSLVTVVVNKPTYQCGYPGCGKSFRYKQNLLCHQTKKHGRIPTRVMGVQRVWMRPGDMCSGNT